MRRSEMALDQARPLPTLAATSRTPGAVALLDRQVWRDAALVWLVQRVALLGLTWLVAAGDATGGARLPVFGLWVQWDGAVYAGLAQHGYRVPSEAVFFPLYPLLEHLLAPLTAGNTAAAGLLIANAAALGAYGLLRLLAERELGPAAARRTLIALALFPTAFFLVAPYTESLFLLLSLGAFLALRREHWLASGTLAALATLTRPVGILLLAPLAVAALEWHRGRPRSRRARLRALGALALAPLALGGYAGYLQLRFGTPLAFVTAQGGTWGRRASWPWDAFLRAGGAVLHAPPEKAIPAALDMLLMLAAVALTLATLRRLPRPYALYACASLALMLLVPMHQQDWGALSSNKRFLLAIFPLFLVLGRAPRHRWLEPLAVLVLLALQALFVRSFLLGGWVA
jgi:hypothetical protein